MTRSVLDAAKSHRVMMSLKMREPEIARWLSMLIQGNLLWIDPKVGSQVPNLPIEGEFVAKLPANMSTLCGKLKLFGAVYEAEDGSLLLQPNFVLQLMENPMKASIPPPPPSSRQVRLAREESDRKIREASAQAESVLLDAVSQGPKTKRDHRLARRGKVLGGSGDGVDM